MLFCGLRKCLSYHHNTLSRCITHLHHVDFVSQLKNSEPNTDQLTKW